MSKWLSRKLLVAIIGTILVPLLQKWGVPQQTIDWIISLLMTYIGGQAIVDTAVAYRAKHPTA